VAKDGSEVVERFAPAQAAQVLVDFPYRWRQVVLFNGASLRAEAVIFDFEKGNCRALFSQSFVENQH
jgi:hypothetical protein